VARDVRAGPAFEVCRQTSNANLLVTLMDKLDVPVEKLGGSTGKLSWIRFPECKRSCG
jgi:hypothetical protein